MTGPTVGPAAGPATSAATRRAGDHHRVLLARIGGERFAFPLAALREAVDAPAVAPVARAPEGVAGQCAHRGRLLPVLDAGALLGVPRAGGAGALLVVDDGEGAPFGLLVDDVEDMVTAPRRAWRGLPGESGASGGVLRALLRLDEGIAALVDMNVVGATARARLQREDG